MKKENNTITKNITLGSFFLGSFMGSALCGSLQQPQAVRRITYNIQATSELENELKKMGKFEYDSYDKFMGVPDFYKMMNFINRGAYPCAENNHHWTLWHFVAKYNCLGILSQFVQRIKNSVGQEHLVQYLNQKNDRGQTPLHVAILNNSNEVVQFLIFNGANLAAKDNFGRSPLQVATMRGNVTAAKALLEAIEVYRPNLLPTYVNTCDRLYQTSLDHAGEVCDLNKRLEITSILLRRGAKTAKQLGQAWNSF
jgi:hypothetical protein